MKRRTSDRTLRETVELLEAGVKHVDRVQPEGIREPVKQVMRSALEVCQIRARYSRSLLGLPITYAVEIAAELVKEAENG